MAMTETSLRQPLRYTIDLSAGLVQQPMRSQLMKGDKKANRVIVHLTDGSKDVTLSGVTVTGSFIRPPDAAEIPLTGEASGSEASVTLEDACYATEGYCEISVKLTVGETSRTILTLTGYVLSKGSGAYVDVSGVIPNIDDVIAQYAEMKRVTQETQAAGTAAGNAAGAASTAADEANRQAQAAQQAAQAADTAASKIDGLTVSAEKANEAGATISQKDGAYHVNFKLPKGDTGATPDITFEVATGAAGSDVQIEQSGTPEAPHIKLTIPRGDTGAVEGVDYYEGNPEALGEASPGTANGVARGDHVHPKPTPGDIGAASIDDTAPNSEKVYSSQKTQNELNQLSEQMANYRTAVNLLDNSDFTQPVNQRGQMSYIGKVGGTYSIDRWRLSNEFIQVDVKDGYVSFKNKGGGSTWSQQYTTFSHLLGKPLTLALKLNNGSVMVAHGVMPVSVPASNTLVCRISIEGKYVDIYCRTDGTPFVQFYLPNGTADLNLEWIAMYEGSYTLETLPPYVPKGYDAELRECQKYFARFNWDGESFFVGHAVIEKGGGRIQFFIPWKTKMITSKPTYCPDSGAKLSVMGEGVTIGNDGAVGTASNVKLDVTDAEIWFSSHSYLALRMNGTFDASYANHVLQCSPSSAEAIMFSADL